MRYLFIVFLFISSFLSGQGIEPTSLQPTQYQGGILRGVIPYVDEFTGETLYIYQHVDSLVFIKDSIYVRNDSILLRDGQGFVKMSAGWGLTVSSAGDSITYVSDTTKLATLFSVSGTNPRIPYFGTNSKLTTTDSLKWDVTNGEIDIKGRLNLGQTGFPSTILIGDEAGKVNQGANNVFLGIGSGYTNRFGTQNIGIGSSTLAFNVDGIRNVAIGHLSQNTSLGSFNTSIGYQSLAFGGGSGQFNTAIGVSAMENNAGGTSNDAIGYNTLRNNTTGSYNVAISGDALRNNQDGSLNVAIGNAALYSNVGGGYNI
ncbi:MAG: hypothetical protein IPO37_13400, partial [Saprospiraceae bacterium]|nr:hypothetical protein [Saprospiraceae bacterium]